MRRFQIDESHEVELEATMWTLVLYEQEFKSDLIADVFGRHEAEEAGSDKVVMDFTTDDWLAELRALWAMARTAYDIKAQDGHAAPADRPPAFQQWARQFGAVNMRDVANVVVELALEGFFRPSAARAPA